MTSYDDHVWAWRRRRGMREWRAEYAAAGPQKHAADIAALHDAERHAARAAAALQPWQRRDVVSAAERAERAAAHALAAERCAALAASPLREREAAGMPTVPAAELLAFAAAEWDEAAAFLPTAVRARIEGAHSGPWRRPPEPSLRAARKLVRVSIVAARIVEHAGGPSPPGQYGAWAPAGAAHATWATAGAVWIAKHVGGRASATDTAEAAAWKARMSRQVAAVADLHARAARALAPALDDLAGEQALAQYARVRGHWLEVARDLPPAVRAEIMSRPRMPARPAVLASTVQQAAYHAAYEFGAPLGEGADTEFGIALGVGAALGALEAADDPAAGPTAAAGRRRRIFDAMREAAADGAEPGDMAAYVTAAVDEAATAAAVRAAAVRAACPAPADMVAAVRAAPVQDVGMRVVETAQFELAAVAPDQAPPPVDHAPVQAPPARPTVYHLGAAGPRACTSAITELMPAAGTLDGRRLICRWPVAPPSARPLRTAGPLALGLIDDLRAAVRPGVDLLALVRGRTRARNDKDYEYSRGTWAERAANETIDVASVDKYDEAFASGRLAGDMVPGLEWPGCGHGGKCTCGLPIVRGHAGGKDSGYEGQVELKPGLMSCHGRPCSKDYVRWRQKAAKRAAVKLMCALDRARLADGGAAGGKRTVLLHLALSFGPADYAEWRSGPAGRARLRAAGIAELRRRARVWGIGYADHSYRFDPGVTRADLSPHLHIFLIGWLDYKVNAERFLKYKDVPYEVRRMRVPAGAEAPAGRPDDGKGGGASGLTISRPACDAGAEAPAGRPDDGGASGLTISRPACGKVPWAPVADGAARGECAVAQLAGGPPAGPPERIIERRYGLGRSVFIKHLSTIETFEDCYNAVDYVLGHSTASARRLGETSGGEHTLRWGGALANGRMQAASVSRFEQGDLIENARVKLPSQMTSLTMWHNAPSDKGEDTVSRAEPRHVYTASGPAECAGALRLACRALQRDHPASPKNGGVQVLEVYDHPDGPAGTLVEACEPTPEDGLPPADYMIIKAVGDSRPEANRIAAGAAKQATAAYQALTNDRSAMRVPGDAGADIAAAAQTIQGAAKLLQWCNEGADGAPEQGADGAPEQGADGRRQAAAKLREGRGRLDAAVGRAYGSLDGARLVGYGERVRAAARAVARALAMSSVKSRWVVLRVDSRMDHLSSDGYRLELYVFDPGGTKNPALPTAAWEGLGMGALNEEVPADDDDRPVDARRPGTWLRMPAAGWLTTREYMQRNAVPYPPAYDPLTRRLVLDDGVLAPAPHIEQAPIETQRGAAYDRLYSLVRAHRRAMRGVDAGPVTREDVRAYMAAHCMRLPTAA